MSKTEKQKTKFCVTGFVEESVSGEVEAKTPRAALLFAVRNRGGNDDINWEDGNWESSVQSIEVRDCKTNEVLMTEMGELTDRDYKRLKLPRS